MKPVQSSPSAAAAPVQVARALLLALLVALALVVVPDKAHAYPEVECEVTVSSQALKSRQKFTVEGSSGQPLEWRVTFAGETRTSTGTTFRERFTAPDVTTTTTYQLQVTGRSADVSVTGSCQRTFDITVSPRGGGTAAPGGGGAGALPNTGGPRVAIAGLALLLLLAGAASLRRARRTSQEA